MKFEEHWSRGDQESGWFDWMVSCNEPVQFSDGSLVDLEDMTQTPISYQW